MEKFYLEEPTLEREKDVIDYIEEHIKYNSETAGTSGLDDGYKDYKNWMKKNELMKNPETCPSDKCAGIQYFFIRESDNKIIGMINLRWNLNEWMLQYGGHIGYGVRPTERQKGYNKINLYLCLLKAKELGLDKVLLTADDENLGSVKTILSFGGELENKIETYKEKGGLTCRYWIDVNKALENTKDIYSPFVANENILKK